VIRSLFPGEIWLFYCLPDDVSCNMQKKRGQVLIESRNFDNIFSEEEYYVPLCKQANKHLNISVSIFKNAMFQSLTSLKNHASNSALRQCMIIKICQTPKVQISNSAIWHSLLSAKWEQQIDSIKNLFTE
jgi:hypothetical protein